MPAHTCVIYNPAAGRGRAERLLREVRAAAGAGIELRPTAGPGHATDLAQAAAEAGFVRVVAAGGDGTVHEAANGLLRSGNRKVVFAVWPLGSANDYAYTLGMIAWWGRRAERPPTKVIAADVGRVTGGGRERFAVANLGVGFNGMVTLEARRCRWLSGMPLYAWGFLRAMAGHFATPRMTVRCDNRETTGPTLAVSLLLAQREGGFPLRPHASLTDGRFDYLHAAGLRRWHLLRYLPAMAAGRLPEAHALLRLGQAERVWVRSEAPLCVHADGEFFSVPGDGVREVTAEVVPGRLRVEVYPPAMYGGRGA